MALPPTSAKVCVQYTQSLWYNFLPLWQRQCHCTEYDVISGNYLGVTTLGDVGTTHTELMNAALPLLVALYGQPPGISMESAR